MKNHLMRPMLLWLVSLLLGNAGLAAVATIDSSSAPLWKPCTTWVQKLPAKYEAIHQAGGLVFRVEGAGSEMPWIMDLKDLGLSGDERYLLVRYKAVGMSTRPGVYFLHGEEGTHGGRTYATIDCLKTDGQWHTLAVDLVAVEPLESTHFLAIKVAAGGHGIATLSVDTIQFAERLPADARACAVAAAAGLVHRNGRLAPRRPRRARVGLGAHAGRPF